MGDAFDLIARRRARAQANPGKTYKQLNEDFLRENKLPVVPKKYEGIAKDYTEKEAAKIEEEDRFEKIKLYNKMKSCGESNIGRTVKDGKHGTFMQLEEEPKPIEVPAFQSPAEQSRYMYNLSKQKSIEDAVSNKLINSVTSHHLLHQVVDQHSLAGKAIEETGKTGSVIQIGDAKEHLIETHKKMYESADYKAVAGVRNLRVLDESEDGILSDRHKEALNHGLSETAGATRTQECGMSEKK